MYTLPFRRLSMLITIIFAASLMVFVTGVFAQSATPTVETEITGVLESITSGSIVVSGQTISVIDAEIKNMLVVGSTVKVHVSTVNGMLIAREVQTAPTASDNTNANSNDNTNTNENSNANSNSNTNDNTNSNSNDNTSITPTVTAQQAIDIVLAVYPTTNILSVELTSKFGGTLVWEVKIRNGIELNIDAQAATILTIDRRGDDNNQSNNGNRNGNSNDNNDDNGNSNDNSDDNGNDNNDDNGNSNDNNDDNGNDNNDDNGGDDGGKGSDDSGSDDNGGMG